MNVNQKKRWPETKVFIYLLHRQKESENKNLLQKMKLFFKNDFLEPPPTYIFIESKCNFCAAS